MQVVLCILHCWHGDGTCYLIKDTTSTICGDSNLSLLGRWVLTGEITQHHIGCKGLNLS